MNPPVIHRLTSITRDGHDGHDSLKVCVEDQFGSGAPVIFQHGLCGDSTQTREAFPKLSGYRPVTLECRGHGRSEAGDLERLSIATFTEDVVALIEDLQTSPVVVGGISMGAAISLRLAVTRPDLVKALILVRPAWVTASAPDNMTPNAYVATLLDKYPQDRARDIFMTSDTAKQLAEIAPDNLNSLQALFTREPRTVTVALLRQISKDGPGVGEAQVQALKIPTLIVGHDRDFIHPYSHAQALASLIPNSTLQAITPKAANKELYISDLHNAITGFLEELPS